MAKKSRPNKMSEPEVLQNTRMKNRTECTGFLARTTIKPETKARLDKTESIVVRRPSLEWNFRAAAFKLIHYALLIYRRSHLIIVTIIRGSAALTTI